MFSRLTLEGWRQFKQIDLQFHTRLTVLTGANGSGKTTILNILNRHFGWSVDIISTPYRDESSGLLKYLSDMWSDLRRLATPKEPSDNVIGAIEYSDGKIADLAIPKSVSHTYSIEMRNQRPVDGLHIPSHRPPITYQSVSEMPTTSRSLDELLTQYLNSTMSHFRGSGGRYPSYNLKEALISMALFGYGNQAVSPNPLLIETFEGFQEVLRKVLPSVIGFESLKIEPPEVVLLTETGNFSFDAVSGGVAALMDLSWQVFMYSTTHDAFVVTIDEPENHLHPQMQREILPNFIDAFPNIQFIVATHNPFIVGSVSESNVYVLDFGEENLVESALLDWRERGGSANEVLRDVLGVPVTFPVWVESSLDEIARKYAEVPLTDESLTTLREELGRLGLSQHLPESLKRRPGGEA